MNADIRKRFEDWFLVFSGYPHDCRTLHAFESMLSCPFDATPDLLLLMCTAFNAGYESGAADKSVECRVECRRGLGEEQ